MKTKTPHVPTRFTRETRFRLPVGAGPPSRPPAAELERLKEQLLRQLLPSPEPSWLQMPLRRAANDAVALAWTTPWPLLVLPLLLEEKAHAARKQAERQQDVLRRSRAIISVAA
ncbi:MAG: hypothetical protein KGS61_14485 [Verrucomicrobia bacterium]|nr:hypothetical protein [Verrucomicrobiota bacterium]